MVLGMPLDALGPQMSTVTLQELARTRDAAQSQVGTLQRRLCRSVRSVGEIWYSHAGYVMFVAILEVALTCDVNLNLSNYDSFRGIARLIAVEHS